MSQAENGTREAGQSQRQDLSQPDSTLVPSRPLSLGTARTWDVLYASVAYLAILTGFYASLSVSRALPLDDEVSPLALFLLEEVVDASVAIGLAAYFLRGRYGVPIGLFAASAHDLRRELGIGILAGPVVWALVAALDRLLQSLFGEPPVTHPLVLRLESATGIGDVAAILLSACVLGPLAEEIFFRGFAYRVFRGRFRRVVAVSLSSLLFAVAHLSPWSFVQVLVIGIALTLVYERSGSLISAVTCHSAVNLLALAGELFDGP